MENLNLVELLRDCPTGMELDSTVFNNVTFDYVNTQQNRVYCKVNKSESVWFTSKGSVNLLPAAKCVIFPKGKTTWEGFVPPYKFKYGDVVINASNKASNAFIYAGEDDEYYKSYVGLTPGYNPAVEPGKSCAWVSKKSGIRLATEEEKQKLFDAIKENGYKWNAETKALEKLPNQKISWHTGTPENLGHYLVTLSDGIVSVDIYLASTKHWDRYRAGQIVAWCPVDEIEPYNHN